MVCGSGKIARNRLVRPNCLGCRNASNYRGAVRVHHCTSPPGPGLWTTSIPTFSIPLVYGPKGSPPCSLTLTASETPRGQVASDLKAALGQQPRAVASVALSCGADVALSCGGKSCPLLLWQVLPSPVVQIEKELRLATALWPTLSLGNPASSTFEQSASCILVVSV